MTATQFYEQLLKDIQVDQATWESARDKRDELADICCGAIREKLGQASGHYPVGALAQGTQIKPLNDVDLAVTYTGRKETWKSEPQPALDEIKGWFEAEFRSNSKIKVSSVETSAHAIKIEFADEQFSADVVPALDIDGQQGLTIPHCPDDKPYEHDWIRTDPVGHRDLVKARNKATNSMFAREVRILKWWNRHQQFQDGRERKPLSSFHMTALAWTILNSGSINYAESTAHFFERAAAIVHIPLPDPSGLGDHLEAKESGYASERFAEAAEVTRRAITAPNPDRVLQETFGNPADQRSLLEGGLFSVAAGGAFVAGSGSGRSYGNPRSHGDGS